jgi:hypothetical protein
MFKTKTHPSSPFSGREQDGLHITNVMKVDWSTIDVQTFFSKSAGFTYLIIVLFVTPYSSLQAESES